MYTVEEALQAVEQEVLASGNENDLSYFRFHKNRFRQMAETVVKICPQNSLVLDAGSHFLHSTLLLHFLGYKVHPMDVQAFWNIPYIQDRATKFGLVPVVENDLQYMNVLRDVSGVYELVVFAEIFEHITFNPISFWQKMREMLKDGGHIYISTPNSLTLYGILRNFANVLRFRGIGIDINSIFMHATYGHHWKEYSSAEIRNYFAKMSDGFQVTIKKYFYRTYPLSSFRQKLRWLVFYAGNRFPYFRDEIEAVIRIDKSKPFKIVPPGY